MSQPPAISLTCRVSTFIKSSFFKFCVVGVINTLTNYGLYLFFLLVLHINYIVSGALGFLLAAIMGYVLNSRFTFKAQKMSVKHLVTYLSVNMVSLAINALVSILVVQVFYCPEKFAQLVGITVTTFTNFFGVKYLVFRHAK